MGQCTCGRLKRSHICDNQAGHNFPPGKSIPQCTALHAPCSTHQGTRGVSEQKRRLKGRALQNAHVICPVALLAGRQPPARCGCLTEKKGSNPYAAAPCTAG